MNEMDRALEADGEKLRQLTGKDHGPFMIFCETEASRLSDHLQHDHPAEPNPKLVDKRIQSLAILIAVEIAKQDNELDNLGDNESVVLMGKCPTINVVQLAENIIAYQDTEVATLQSRIEALQAELALWPWERTL